MITKLHFALLMLLLSCLPVYCEKPKNYGQFGLEIVKVDTCKGPKKKDCGVYNVKVVSKTEINFDFLLNEDMSPRIGKVITVSNNNEMMRLQLNKPCENLFLMPVFRVIFNITSNCVIKKGHYAVTLNFEDVLRNYYGGMHLYGLWGFKSYFSSNQCNLSCTYIEVNINGKN